MFLFLKYKRVFLVENIVKRKDLSKVNKLILTSSILLKQKSPKYELNPQTIFTTYLKMLINVHIIPINLESKQ